MFKIPIVLSVHTRPEYLKKQIEILKSINPKKVYTLIDPPAQDIKKIVYFKRSLDILNKSNLNLIPLVTNKENRGHFITFFEGCKKLITIGENYLILENDSIPTISYFNFVENIFSKFNNDKDFLHVSGCTYFKFNKAKTNIYFKSKFVYPTISPSSTPQHSEDVFFNMDKNIEIIESKIKTLNSLLKPRALYLVNNFNTKQYNKIDIDTYLLFYAMIKNKFSIFPYNNLVENCGFDTQSRNVNFNKHKTLNLINLNSYNNLPTVQANVSYKTKQQKILRDYLLFK